MPEHDTTTLLLAGAAALWATAGATLLRDAVRTARSPDHLLAFGLLLGGLLLGIHTLPLAGSSPLPLAPMALLAAALASRWHPGAEDPLVDTDRLRDWALALGAGLLLHWLQELAPLQPRLGLTRPLELALAVPLGWAAVQALRAPRPRVEACTAAERGAMLACGAAASLVHFFGLPTLDTVAALLLCCAPLGFLIRRARVADLVVPLRGAVAVASAFLCLLAAGQARLAQRAVALAECGQQLAGAEQALPALRPPLEEVLASWGWIEAGRIHAERSTAARDRTTELQRLAEAADLPTAVPALHRLADALASHIEQGQKLLEAARRREQVWEDAAARSRAEVEARQAQREALLALDRAGTALSDAHLAQQEAQAGLGARIGSDRNTTLAALAMLIALGAAAASSRRRDPDSPVAVPAAGPPRVRLDLTLGQLVRELRGPVTSVAGCAELLADAELPALERAGHLCRMTGQARRAGELLTAMEELGRLAGGGVRFADDTFALDQLCQAVVAEWAPAAKERGVDLRLELPAALPRWVQGDALRFRQLLAALLDHAVGITPTGVVTMGLQAEGGWLMVTVQDEGPAVATDLLHTVFTGAERQSASTGSSALALALARALSGAMGGELTARSLGEQGNELRLQLPLRPARARELPLDELAEWPPPQPRLQGRVLLATESSGPAEPTVRELLVQLGLEVAAAGTGEAALSLLEQERFDLVVMDVALPGLDGLAATVRLRARKDTTPVLALTTEPTPGIQARCLAAGCNGTVGPPLATSTLAAALSLYLPAAAPAVASEG